MASPRIEETTVVVPNRRRDYSPRRDSLGRSWRDLAACQSLDVRMFYPDTGKGARPAQRVCASCPVRAACLEHALDVGERHGVWGGATEDERRAIRRTRRAAS